jgi:hypothetical protein
VAFYVFVEMEISNRAGLEPYRAAVNDTIAVWWTLLGASRCDPPH